MLTKIKSYIAPSNISNQDRLMEFKSHYEENQQYIRNIIYWMVRVDDIDDIVQDTFVKAWKSFHKFQGDSTFRTWIYKIAQNTVYDYSRKHSRPLIQTETVEVLDQSSNKDLISKALLSLDLKYRELLVLSYKFEYTTKEIAELLEMKEGTVKSRLHTAKKEFAQFCKNHGVSNE